MKSLWSPVSDLVNNSTHGRLLVKSILTNLPHDASLGAGIAPPLTQLTVAGFDLFIEGAITLCMMSKGLVPLGSSDHNYKQL